MSPAVKAVLTFAAAALAAAAAAGPAGMPEWAQITLAALAAGFAAIGIVPPTAILKRATDAPEATETPMMRGIKAESMGAVYERGYEHGYGMGSASASAAMNEQAELADLVQRVRILLATQGLKSDTQVS